MNNMQQEVSNPRMQAEALKRMGRGPDTQLIHMTDSEIGALNGLSGLVFNEPLRTNPETGLPEAGLFKQLLPTVLAIGAGAFLGPAAAGLFAGGAAPGALAMGVGTGLAAGAGHLAGQAVTGQDLDFGRALLAGAGSGLTAGLTFNPAEVAGAGTDVGLGSLGDTAGAPDFANVVPVESASAAIPAIPSPAISPDANLFGGVDYGADLTAFGTETVPLSQVPTFGTGEASFLDSVRSPTEAFDYLAAEPMKRVAMPLGMAALSGELDEPLPEAPSGPPRTPFTPKDFDFTRSRRDLDRDEDGEVTQADILEVVQELPEGQSSRFYTPGVFTEAAKEGGLLRLQTGGNIQEAIGALTGGGGASVLPMIAQSVVKPEDEEEESISKGYPVGKAGTAPGMPTTGIAVGGGQPPQPFQTGGDTGSALGEAFSETEADTGFGFGIGQGTNSGVDAANVAGTVGGLAGLGLGVPGLGQVASGIAQAGQYASIPEAQRGSLQFSVPSLFGLGPTIGEQHTNLTTQRELDIGLAEAEEAEAQASFNAAMGLASLAMAEEDAPEDVGQEAVEEAAAAAAAIGHAADIDISGGGPGGGSGSGGGGSTGGGHDIGGTEGSQDDDTSDSPDGSGDDSSGSGDGGEGGGPAGDKTGGLLAKINTPLGDPYKQGGYLGAIGMAQGGDLMKLLNNPAMQKMFDGNIMNMIQTAGASAPTTPPAAISIDTPIQDEPEPIVDELEQLQQVLAGLPVEAQRGGLVSAFAMGGMPSPYFEGRVMPTGNMTEDGMSDNIPFVIAGRQEGGQMGMQPAVLSPDEYVIPADVVSMLGNGSSTAGANDLDQFINNFRMDKYGRPKQPPEMSGGLSSLA